MEKKNEFKPYIPADKIVPEFTVTSIVIGIILAVVFGAANAYLGLIVGMTVSASIPAAVISMGIIRVILRKDSILENNLVQTIGSAGESVAAGAIFTLPALFIWAEEGKIAFPSMMTIFLVALFGGVLGICFMVPLRQALIVEEHGTLPFPGRNSLRRSSSCRRRGRRKSRYCIRRTRYRSSLQIHRRRIQIIPKRNRLCFQKLCRISDRYSGSSCSCRCRLHLWTEDFKLHACRRYSELVRTYAGNRFVRR